MIKNFQGPKLGEKLGFLLFSPGCFIGFDMAQDCSLGQCLTSSRAETSKRNFCGSNWGRNDLVEHPLKSACFLKAWRE